MGIKGGIARKLLKELYGTPEPPGSFDIDVLVFIEHYTHEDRKAARELVTGMRLGGLVLQAQDVEVMTKVGQKVKPVSANACRKLPGHSALNCATCPPFRLHPGCLALPCVCIHEVIGRSCRCV